jgi:hypothetical protein
MRIWSKLVYISAVIGLVHAACTNNTAVRSDDAVNTGGAASGGTADGGAAGGGTAGGGAGGTAGVRDAGRADGPGTGGSCYASAGTIPGSAKACSDAIECKQQIVPSCCGASIVVGLNRSASCVFPTPNCTGLGCPVALWQKAEDGNSTETGGVVEVRCQAGLCKTVVANRGSGGAGGSTTGASGGAGGTGGSGSGDAGGSEDAGAYAGICTTDSDCIFRTNAGCCGVCQATNDRPPPPIPCGAMCPTVTNCACVNNHCTVGTLSQGSACQSGHDLCMQGTKCCSACGGAYRPDSGCAAPVCTPVFGIANSCPLYP